MMGDASSMQATGAFGDSSPEASAGESAGDMAWNSMFRQLVQYKAAQGHCFVPLRWRENPQLGAWLAEQGLPAAGLPRNISAFRRVNSRL